MGTDQQTWRCRNHELASIPSNRERTKLPRLAPIQEREYLWFKIRFPKGHRLSQTRILICPGLLYLARIHSKEPLAGRPKGLPGAFLLSKCPVHLRGLEDSVPNQQMS